MKSFIFAILILFVCISDANSQSTSLLKTKIRVIAAEGPFGFNCEETLDYYNMAAYIIRTQTNVKLNIKFVCRENVFHNSPNVNNSVLIFEAWDKLLKNRILPTTVISSPVIRDGIIYTGGFGYIGMFKGLSWSHVAPRNSEGLDRTQFAIIAITHELGHMLGAPHDESPNSIMSTNALYRLSSNPNLVLGFTTDSRFDIRQEIRFYNKYKDYDPIKSIRRIKPVENCNLWHGIE